MRAMIDTVLFDLDSTLVDDGPNWRRSVTETIQLLRERHPPLEVDQVRSAYYATAGAVWEEIRGVEASPWGNMDDAEIVRRVWRDSLSAVRLDDPDLLEVAVARYVHLRCSGSPAFDDAKSCLDHLAFHYRLGVVTNGFLTHQAPKLEVAGLTSYFPVVTTTDTGFGKPRSEIFLQALDALGSRPETSVYVGDSLAWDVGGANGAGMFSIWLNRRSAQREASDPIPHQEIRTLAELPDAILALSSD